MDFDWDEGKDAANRAKHGVSLADAVRLEWGRAKQVMDRRHDYGEDRTIVFGHIGDRLYVCVLTRRNGKLRIISLRKANGREIRKHGI